MFYRCDADTALIMAVVANKRVLLFAKLGHQFILGNGESPRESSQDGWCNWCIHVLALAGYGYLLHHGSIDLKRKLPRA